ncbi:MAG TPA: gluconokinase [Fodinibius sp.]|nr:gluconokinase [Fodinibius sp.]
MVYIVMGVSGAGKSLIGSKLARELRLPFFDADHFHPQENITKMESSQPLNDRDRWPWLQRLRKNIAQWEQEGGAILACSALKRSYRRVLAPPEIPVQFIYLKGPEKLILKRMNQRDGHFMPEELLASQFDALEEPAQAITVNIDQSPAEIVRSLCKKISGN